MSWNVQWKCTPFSGAKAGSIDTWDHGLVILAKSLQLVGIFSSFLTVSQFSISFVLCANYSWGQNQVRWPLWRDQGLGQGIISLLNYPELTDEDVSDRLSVSCRSWHTQAIARITKEMLEPCNTER